MPHNDVQTETQQRKNIQKTVEAYERDLRQKVNMALCEYPEVLFFSSKIDRSLSTRLILLHPIPDPDWKYVGSDYEATLMTPHIAALFSDASTQQQIQQAKDLYEFLLSNGPMRSAAGWVFETRVHIRFERGGNFAVTSLSGPGTLDDIAINHNVNSSSKVSTFVFNQLAQLCAHLRVEKGSPDIDPQMYNVYPRPERCNLESIDALTIIQDAQTLQPRLLCFQITVGAKHAVKAAGLKALWQKIPASVKKLQPALIFVVPAETADSFSAQRIEGRDPQDQEWSQYTLPMDGEQLWGVKTL